jgi:hypothetical protein
MATITRTTALLAAIWAGGGCTHAGGKLMVDAPKLLPYEAPDIDEITGIDPDEPDDEAGATSGSAQPPQQ